MLKADLHVHTEYSLDCDTPLDKIIERCQQTGINCVAIADHGTTEGALKMRELAPFKVIVAEEILTHRGEIIGMFLKEKIPSGLSAEETISRIREQDGLVCIPHPFDTIRPSAMNGDSIVKIIEHIDIVEVFNARTLLTRYCTRALAFARKHGIPGSAGSDAHTLQEIGNAYIEMPEFNGKDDFLQALAMGEIFGRRTGPMARFSNVWTKVKKQF